MEFSANIQVSKYLSWNSSSICEMGYTLEHVFAPIKIDSNWKENALNVDADVDAEDGDGDNATMLAISIFFLAENSDFFFIQFARCYVVRYNRRSHFSSKNITSRQQHHQHSLVSHSLRNYLFYLFLVSIFQFVDVSTSFLLPLDYHFKSEAIPRTFHLYFN